MGRFVRYNPVTVTSKYTDNQMLMAQRNGTQIPENIAEYSFLKNRNFDQCRIKAKMTNILDEIRDRD
jgi:hypothetical protein